jgi:hypothetical protein
MEGGRDTLEQENYDFSKWAESLPRGTHDLMSEMTKKVYSDIGFRTPYAQENHFVKHEQEFIEYEITNGVEYTQFAIDFIKQALEQEPKGPIKSYIMFFQPNSKWRARLMLTDGVILVRVMFPWESGRATIESLYVPARGTRIYVRNLSKLAHLSMVWQPYILHPVVWTFTQDSDRFVGGFRRYAASRASQSAFDAKNKIPDKVYYSPKSAPVKPPTAPTPSTAPSGLSGTIRRFFKSSPKPQPRHRLVPLADITINTQNYLEWI